MLLDKKLSKIVKITNSKLFGKDLVKTNMAPSMGLKISLIC